MKAVNQCIGRAVRHIADYSTVVLLDRRYANKTKSLPGWIQRTLTIQPNFGGCVQALARFFAAKRRLKETWLIWYKLTVSSSNVKKKYCDQIVFIAIIIKMTLFHHFILFKYISVYSFESCDKKKKFYW